MSDILSIDVEDWYHILEVKTTPVFSEWQSTESRVERNFNYLLNIFDEHNIKVTCFFLGWIAQRYPHLVKEASKRHHEIASHGFSHQLIYTQTQKQFFDDIKNTKSILEDICGEEVIGYRAPGFSITKKSIWALNLLAQAGYIYDSSIFPARRGHGYLLNVEIRPFRIFLNNGNLFEFPITVKTFLSTKLCFFGGGYLRLFPYCLIRAMANKVAKENRPVIYYLHPRDLDVGQPRLKMPIGRKFKSYYHLSTTEYKIRKIISAGKFYTFKEYINTYANDIKYSRSTNQL